MFLHLRRESSMALGYLAKLHPGVVQEEVLPPLLQRLTHGEWSNSVPCTCDEMTHLIPP